MPFNKDGSRKTMAYKKSSGFKMKNPIKFMGMGAVMGAVKNTVGTMGQVRKPSGVKSKSPAKLLDNVNLSLFSSTATGQKKTSETGDKNLSWSKKKNKTKTKTKLKNVGNQ